MTTPLLHFWSFLIGEIVGIAICMFWMTRSR